MNLNHEGAGVSKKLIFTFVMAFSLILSKAVASNDAVELCNSMSEDRARNTGLSFEPVRGDGIGLCLSNFVKINSPKAHVLEFEKENPCGFICRSKFGILARTYNADGYVGLIKERLTVEELDKVEKTTGISLEQLVLKEYNLVEVYNSQRATTLAKVKRNEGRAAYIREAFSYKVKEYGLPLLKSIILEFSKLSLKARAIDLKIENSKDVIEDINALKSEIAECLEVVTTENGLGLCVEKFEENTVYKIGRRTLDVYLDQNFETRVDKKTYGVFKQRALKLYDICSIEYFFNAEEILKKQSDKILPCVFNPLFESFVKIAKDLIIKNSKMNQVEVQNLAVELIDKCGESSLLSLAGNARRRELQKFTVEKFTNYLLNCQKSITLGVVAKVGSKSISEHPAVIDILGKEKAAIFADEILVAEIPLCFQKLGTDEEPEKCVNYLFAKTAKKLFPQVLEQRFLVFKTKYSFLTDELIKDSRMAAQAELNSCQKNLFKDFRSFSNMNSKNAEILTAKCLRQSILSSLEKVVDAYVQSEIQNNKVLQENGIVFGPSRKKQIKADFLSCTALNISTSEGLKSVVRTSSSFLDKCVLSLTKDVVQESFGTIVLENLLELGLSSEQVAVVYADYKKTPNNLLEAVLNSKTTTEVESHLVGAKEKIISSTAQDVIKFLMINKSPVSFGPDMVESLSKAGAEELVNCLMSRELADCASEVETGLTRRAIEAFLPQAAYDEFTKALKSVVSSSEIKSYKILEKIEKDIRTSKKGKELIAYIIEEFAKGVSVDEIKKDKRLTAYISGVALEPIAGDLIKSLVLKKSPIKFSTNEMKSLVASGKETLISCLKKEDASKCADRAEETVLKKAVVIYLPKSVNAELKAALSNWFTSSEINAYRLESKFKQSLTSGKSGVKVLNYIASQLDKGISTNRLKTLPKVTSYIYLVLSTYKAPGRSGLMILDHIGHNIIQKEVNKFVVGLQQGKEGFFTQLGAQIHFAGAKAKTAFDWSNSKRTKSGIKATAAFKAIFNKVVERGAKISKADEEALKELVKAAILEYRNYIVNKN